MQQSGTFHIEQYMYHTKDKLGEGSFGKVYKGVNSQTNEPVAIKILDMSLFNEDKFMLESLQNEINVMKELHNQHVVRLFDRLGDSKQTILVLELCDSDLRAQMELSNGMFDEKYTTEVLNQLMEGFQDMVNHGYVHRDIKPENALASKGQFKVADFGFATKADIHGRQLLKDCVGTPLYMAPQILERKPYTAKSDIWSIGVLVYEMLFGRTPWPCRDLNSYVQNMKTMTLRFPFEKPISEEMKDFIKRSLTVDESARLGWDDVFNHPILKKHFGERVYVEEKIDNKTQQILAAIQQLVQARSLDVSAEFKKFDTDKGGFLDQVEFGRFIASLDPRVTQYEEEHLFKFFDSNGDGTISLEEFKRVFSSYDFSDLNDRAGQIIVDLKEIIKANNLRLQDIFANFDGDKGGNLDFNEFGKLIRVIAPAIKEKEILAIFKKFDQDNSGGVSFIEFSHELKYGTDQHTSFNPQNEKAKKLISELKRIVVENQVDVNLIFNNFDKDRSGSLSEQEFFKLCQVIDPKIRIEETTAVYQLVDKDKSGQINIEEFRKLFL